MTKISIVIPCFNEEQSISEIVSKFAKVNANFELILVDNGSNDLTRKEIRKQTKLYNWLKPIYLDTNIGYGGGIKAGIMEAMGEIIAWTHADLQTDPLDIFKIERKFFNEIKNGAIVKGKRISRKSYIDKMISLVFEKIFTLLLGFKVAEINAQPKVFNKKIMNRFINEPTPNDFSLDMYFLVFSHMQGIEIIEYEVEFKDRQFGIAKGGGGGYWNRLILALKFVKDIIHIRKRIVNGNSKT